METLGNFNSHFGREVPAERYIGAIQELARQDAHYLYTCYLEFAQNVLESVVGQLKTIDPNGAPEQQVQAICGVPGIHLARVMVVNCVALGKLIHLFAKAVAVDDDNQRIHDSFEKIVLKSMHPEITGPPTAVSNLIEFFGAARFDISNMQKTKVVITEGIAEFCLRNMQKALLTTRFTPSDDAGLAIRHLPDAVVYKAFEKHLGLDDGMDRIDSLEGLVAFADANAKQICDNYWMPKGVADTRYYVEAFAPVDDFIHNLSTAPLDKMLQLVWYATHMHGEDSEISVRFLLNVPVVDAFSASHPAPKDSAGSTVRKIKKTMDDYDAWVKGNDRLSNRLVGVDLHAPEAASVDEGTVKAFFNELHNRVFIERDHLLVLHVTVNHIVCAPEDLAVMNRWIPRWQDIKEPMATLNGEIGNEILVNYVKSKRLSLNLDELKLVRFCHSGLETRIGEKEPAFSCPSLFLNKESFEKLNARKESVSGAVVGGYLASIFHHTNARLRLGYVSQMSDETLTRIAESPNICVDIVPVLNVRETILSLNITPRQLGIAKELLLIENDTDTYTQKNKCSNDLLIIEKAVEIHFRENNETGNPRKTILHNSSIKKIVDRIPTQFLIGDGGAGIDRINIAKEYEFFMCLVGSASALHENADKYSRFVMTEKFDKAGLTTSREAEKGPAASCQSEAVSELVSEPVVQPSETDEILEGDLLLDHLFEDDF